MTSPLLLVCSALTQKAFSLGRSAALFALLLTCGAGHAQNLTLEAPAQVMASAGDWVQFDLTVLGLPQAAAAGTHYDALRFTVVGVGTVVESGAVDSSTGRLRWRVPCTDAGKRPTLQFRLFNAGALLATASTVVAINKEVPPIRASYPQDVLANPEAPSTFDITVASACGGAVRLETLPNTWGVIQTVSGAFPNYKVTLSVKEALRGKEFTLSLRLGDGVSTTNLSYKVSVDDTPRPPYFDRDLVKRIEVYEDQTEPIRIRAFDPNPGDRVSYIIKNISELRGQAQITDQANGILTWNGKPDLLPSDRDQVEYPIVVEASDNTREATTETFTVVVMRKISVTQRQQRLRRYSDEFKRLETLRDQASAFYRQVDRRADRRSNSEVYRIVAKSMLSIVAGVSATIRHEQTRVIAVTSASVLVAGVDLIGNRRRKYDPFDDLKAIRELIKSITVALSERRYKYNDPELGDLKRLAFKDDILDITRNLATECDKFEVELGLLRDRYSQKIKLFQIK